MRKEQKEFKKWAEGLGATVEVQRNGHLRTRVAGRIVANGSLGTASDFRSLKNAKAAVRRALRAAGLPTDR